MSEIAKILVLGPPEGPQGKFVSAISQIKVKGSGNTPTGNGFIPMSFGRVKLAIDLDLQIFGVERDQASVFLGTINSGVVGAIVLADESDTADPHYAAQALDELAHLGIPTVVGLISAEADVNAVASALGIEASAVVPCTSTDREGIKTALISVLEVAVRAAEGSAA